MVPRRLRVVHVSAALGILIALTLLLTAYAMAGENRSPEPALPEVYLLRLRPAPGPIDGFEAAYEELRPALLDLRSSEQVLNFQYLPAQHAVRIVALAGAADHLAAHPLVDRIELLADSRSPASLAAGRASSPSLLQPYTISGTVRKHDGTPVEGASVSTAGADPDYAWDNTDADGAYTLSVDVAGTYHVDVWAAGLPSLPEQTATVPPDKIVNFMFPQTYTLSGVVRDQYGSPVADAHVSGGYGFDTTAADGSYTLEAVAGIVSVWASKTGYHYRYSVYVPLPPTALDVDLTLIKEDGVIHGRVVDDLGVPIDGARLYASHALCSYEGWASATTETDGTYTMSVPPGIYLVEADHDGYVPGAVEEVEVTGGSSVEVDFVLDRATNHVRGTVRDDQGQPLEDAHVTAWAPCGEYYSTDTTATGQYTLTVGTGTFDVDAYKAGYDSPDSQTVVVPPDVNDIDFVLTEADEPPVHTYYTITGQITDLMGQPISDVQVRGEEGGWDWTNDDGEYELHVDPGTYHVEAFKEGYLVPAAQVATVPPSQSGVDFTLEPSNLTIAGAVQDEHGAPVLNAVISVDFVGEPWDYSGHVFYDGTYLLPASPGAQTVSAYASCYTTTPDRDLTLPPSQTGIDFTLHNQDQLISGIVWDSAGNPLCGAQVEAALSGGADTFSDYGSAWNGRYSIACIDGTYSVVASKYGYGASPPETVTVPPHARQTDLVLAAATNTVGGTVRDKTGAAVPGAIVQASNDSGSVSIGTGADGTYLLWLVDGSWTVTAHKADYRLLTAPQAIVVPPNKVGIDFVMEFIGNLQWIYLPMVIHN